MDIQGRHVLVTGGAGFIGSHVVDRLVDVGARVTVVDDFSVGSRTNVAHHGDAIRVVEGDIRSYDLMREITADVDVVIHMAVASLRVSLNDPVYVHEVNATGTLEVWRAAVAGDVRRMVYVSSSEAYGSAVTIPMSEEHPLVPTTVYGASKAAGELYAMAHLRTYGMETMVIRPFNNYGPREHATGTSAEVIPKFVHRVMAGLPPVIFGDGSQSRDFTWVQDCARGIVLATECDELVGQSVNIAHGQEVSIARVAELVTRRLGRPDLCPEFTLERPGDVDRHFAAVEKAKDLLGFTADVDIVEGIDRYVTWLEQQDIDLDAWVAQESVRNW